MIGPANKDEPPTIPEQRGIWIRRSQTTDIRRSATPCIMEHDHRIGRSRLGPIAPCAYRFLRTEHSPWFGLSKKSSISRMYQKVKSFTTTSLTAPPFAPYDRVCPIPRFAHDLAERPRGVAVSTETHSAIADLLAVSLSLAVMRGPFTPRCGVPRSRSASVGVKSLLGAGPGPGIEHRTGRLGPADSRTSSLFGGSSAPDRFFRRAPSAAWQESAEFAPKVSSAALPARAPQRYRQPPSERLDRPPRSLGASGPMQASG